ncbi:nicotinate-nucleotide adenylyltransferase [Sphingomonas sp. BIUV-7]|uniref:Probable nicotinate-nucleotide adenylyltransferase n=1 Tax=Sphingomonas natans TaxID=3063330 RepID=A0ABT8Y7V8_9SPHN|nr:nicotinate-nucleotide adenylyltransferase [Sphingomonas sp. BIUV-7]MDO6413983.1 nicotinate-nucleotide adenylyltransferase [Sphingomonas sp. BIUV-7]
MARARDRTDPALSAPRRPTGILGGSFNPAHAGHRAISLAALQALDLDEVWWLVSPGNPLKDAVDDMAPLAARLASAEHMARGARIVPTAIEARLHTRYTVDTLTRLVRLYPRRRFVWIMGADNLAQFHLWKDWRKIARTMPIAVVARPGYDRAALNAPAMGWLRRFVRPARQEKDWTKWSTPALVLLRFRPDPRSATQARAMKPAWFSPLISPTPRDRLTRRVLPQEVPCPLPPNH